MNPAVLEGRLEDPGFTPGKRDFGGLYAMLVGDDDALADKAERALSRAGEAAAKAVVASATASPPPPGTSYRVARALGLLGGEEARVYLAARLRDGTGKERRWAGTSLAKVWPAGAEDALLTALADATRGEDLRAFAQALGKVGGSRTRAALAALRPEDPETKRVVDKALLVLTRTAERPGSEGATVDLGASLPEVTVRLTCRDGLESVLAEELAEAGAEVTATTKGRVTIVHRGPLAALSKVRTALTFALEIDAPRRPEVDLPTRVVETLTSAKVSEVLALVGPAPVARFRLELPEGAGRAAIFEVAAKIAAASATLRNDPTNSAWTFTVEPRGGRLSILLEPRHAMRERFAGRAADVPAASHPTIAAALARLSRPTPGDVVWDPFCGAGTELLERANLGKYRALIGSDIQDQAIAAARKNMHHAGVAASLSLGSALDCPLPDDVSVVVTNPPLGRRVRGEHMALLEAVLVRIGSVLGPGGRLVWVSPSRKLDPHAEAAGLHLERALDVDLGGFPGRIEVRTKR